MKVTETTAVMMLAVLKDGTPGTGEAQICGMCHRFKTEFITSPGLRAKVTSSIAERTVACTNSDTPCLMAMKAKSVLDALKEACR